MQRHLQPDEASADQALADALAEQAEHASSENRGRREVLIPLPPPSERKRAPRRNRPTIIAGSRGKVGSLRNY